MVIYLHNKYVETIERILRADLDVAETAAEQEAILATLELFENGKQQAPYRLWLRANPPTNQENTA